MQHHFLCLCSSPAWLCGAADKMNAVTCNDLSTLLLRQHALQSAMPFRAACCKNLQLAFSTDKQVHACCDYV